MSVIPYVSHGYLYRASQSSGERRAELEVLPAEWRVTW